MINRIAVVTCAALMVSTGCAQQPIPQPAGPQATPQSDPRTPPPESHNAWFDKLNEDLGTFLEGEQAVGVFEFSNPRAVGHKLSNLRPSCTCTRAEVLLGDRKYEVGADKMLYRYTEKNGVETKERVSHINVDPGEKGEVRVYMEMHGIRGTKQANLGIQTSDKELPMINLRWSAVGATFFTVEPPDVNLNEMTWEDQREFQFRISSPLKDDFNLVSHEPLPKAMKVSYEKKMENGRAVWIVKGTYGPGAEERDGGGVIRFTTDVDGKTVEERVVAFLKGPLTMIPGGFVSLGNIKSAEGAEARIVLTPAGSFDLQAEKIEVARLRGVKDDQREFVKFTSHKEGKDLVVLITVEEGMKPTYLNGIVKIHLNHPAASLKEVMFNGFVR